MSYTLNGQVFGFFRKQLEFHSHQSLHIRFETGSQVGDTGIYAVSESFEFIVIGAINTSFLTKRHSRSIRFRFGG